MEGVGSTTAGGALPRLRALRLPRAGAIAARWSVPALVVFGAFLRLATLGSQSLWQDEVYTRELATMPFRSMLQGIAGTESTPPVYYVASGLWVRLFGESDASLRTISALCGIALIYVVFRFGRRLAGQGAGIALAALVAVHPLAVWYSQEARSYSLALLLSTLGWIAFLAIIDRPTPEGVMWWALASAGAITTHYTTAFFVATQGVWLLVARRRLWRPMLVAFTGLALVGVSLAALAAVQLQTGHTDWIKAIGVRYRLEGTVREALAGVALPTWHPTVVLALIAATAITIAVWRPDAKRIFMPALVSLAAIGLIVLARRPIGDFVLGRNMVFGWVPLLAVVAVGLTSFPKRWMSIAATAVTCAILLAVTYSELTDDRLQRPNWRGVAAAIGPATKPRLVISTDRFGSQPLRAYLPATEVTFGVPRQVDDIAIVTLQSQGFLRGCGGGAICAIDPTTPGPIPGFTPVSQKAVPGHFVVTDYRAPRAITVDPGVVAQTAVQPPGQVSNAYVQLPPTG